MARIAVVYKSRYGSTKTYAKWLAEALAADLLDCPKPAELAVYDTLVFGGGLYGGSIGGMELLTKNYALLAEKRLVVFTVGLFSVDSPAAFLPTLERVFTPEMRQHIRFFHLRGGMDYTRLSPLHRLLIVGLRMALRKKAEPTQDDKLLLESFGNRVNFCDKQAIDPIVRHLSNHTDRR